MDSFEETKSYIEKIKEKHNIPYTVYLVENGPFMGLCMKNRRKSKLFLSYEPILICFHSTMHQVDMSFEDFLEFLLLHEYGHAKCDKSLRFVNRIKGINKVKDRLKNIDIYNKITKNMVLSNEQRAWDIARKMIGKSKLRTFNQVEKKVMFEFDKILS